jgi:hypothetical protein
VLSVCPEDVARNDVYEIDERCGGFASSIRRVKWLVLVVLATFAAPAQAARWRWSGPASCLGSRALEDAIAARADRSLDELALEIDVTIDNDEGRGTLIAKLEVGGVISDSRVIESDSCAELTEALGVVIARLVATLAPRRAEAPAPAAATRVTEPAVVSREREWNAGLRVSGIIGTGRAPGTGIAGEVGGWAAWRSFAIGISGSRWATNTAMLAGTMSGVEVALQAVAVRAGWQPSSRRLRAWAVGELGSIRGVGVGLDQDRGGAVRWSAVGVGAGLAFRLRRQVTAVVGAEAEVVLDRAKFTVGGGTIVYRTPPFALHGSVGLELGWR